MSLLCDFVINVKYFVRHTCIKSSMHLWLLKCLNKVVNNSVYVNNSLTRAFLLHIIHVTFQRIT